jgi:hypothetical protein
MIKKYLPWLRKPTPQEGGGFWFEPKPGITAYQLAVIIREVCGHKCGVSADFPSNSGDDWEGVKMHFEPK